MCVLQLEKCMILFYFDLLDIMYLYLKNILAL